jgi:hypothetical protein
MADLTNAVTRKNEQGETEVALRYHQEGQVFLSNNPTGKEYVATTSGNVCLVWVDERDVDFILAKKGSCCGGTKKQLFHITDETHIRRWENGGGR